MTKKQERVYVCVDDTDDLTKITSTGMIADAIAKAVQEEFGGKIRMGTTRHQLFLDKSVPYTSHNSAMCFDMLLPAGSAERVNKIGWEKINQMRAESANPGLCILATDVLDDQEIKMRYRDLISYGKKAKVRYVTREEAVEQAKAFPEIILRWDGETGQGRIGSLAGVGLRMSGEDGRFRGKYHLKKLSEEAVLTVEKLTALCERHLGTRPVFADNEGHPLDLHEKVQLADKVKPVLLGGQMVMLCGQAEDGSWIPHSKDSLPKENTGNKKRKVPGKGSEKCPYFELDPDEEERFQDNRPRSCGACLYRRLESDGYSCSKGIMKKEVASPY